MTSSKNVNFSPEILNLLIFFRSSEFFVNLVICAKKLVAALPQTKSFGDPKFRIYCSP